MPFNRAERRWISRSSAGVDNTVAFGSTRNLSTGRACPYLSTRPMPCLMKRPGRQIPLPLALIVIIPYETSAIIGISAMSLWGSVEASHPGAVSRGETCRYLSQYRGGGPVPSSSGRRLRHCFSDRYSKIWRAQ